MLGIKLSSVLEEVEKTLIDHQVYTGSKINFSINGFRAAIKIFSDALMDKMYEIQIAEGMDLEDMQNMAEKCGIEIRKLVKIYTDIDTHDLYK